MIDEFRERFNSMPSILKIACGATFLLGMLQLIAMVFPSVSPNLAGIVLTNPGQQLIVGTGHVLLGWGIFERKGWARPLLIVFPVFQYTIMYIAIQLPISDIPSLDLVWTMVWVAFFGFYCYLGGGRSHFERKEMAA